MTKRHDSYIYVLSFFLRILSWFSGCFSFLVRGLPWILFLLLKKKLLCVDVDFSKVMVLVPRVRHTFLLKLK